MPWREVAAELDPSTDLDWARALPRSVLALAHNLALGPPCKRSSPHRLRIFVQLRGRASRPRGYRRIAGPGVLDSIPRQSTRTRALPTWIERHCWVRETARRLSLTWQRGPERMGQLVAHERRTVQRIDVRAGSCDRQGEVTKVGARVRVQPQVDRTVRGPLPLP